MKTFYLVLCLFVLSTESQSAIRRVKAGAAAGGNGSSWTSPYNNLQTAISASVSGDEIWVASGSYTAATWEGFQLKNGVKIYGGFAGNTSETTIGMRNPRLNVVNLRGNNGRVLYATGASAATLIDGVTVTAGTGASDGGGLYCHSTSSPVINNVIFTGNSVLLKGGAVYVTGNSNPTFTQCAFISNSCTNNDGSGGAVYSESSAPVFQNCFFQSNTARYQGGAVYNTNTSSDKSTRKPSFASCVFIGNTAYTSSTGLSGEGGAIMNFQSAPNVVNCTFVNNVANASTGAAFTSTFSAAPTVVNCLFWNNTGPGGVARDVTSYSSSTISITYSFFKETSTFSGTGNLTATASPFVNLADPDGTDNIFGTSDDGLRIALCSPVIDKGQDNATTLATDIAGQTRKYNVGLIENGAGGFIDIGAYEDQTATTISQLAGTIGNAHMVPTPQELFPDFITSVVHPISGSIRSWQRKDGSNWISAGGLSPADSNGLRLPTLTQSTTFRRLSRSATYCNIDYPSNEIQITVVVPNGAITGRVVSNNGIPVQGITINATRLGGAIQGSPANHTYSAVTAADGTYSISPMYYGDRNNPNAMATFRVAPVKANHVFDYPYLDRQLSSNIPQISAVNFVDETVFAVTGRTFQYCADCLNTNNAEQPQSCPIDSVDIYVRDQFKTRTGFIDTAFGRFAHTVADPGTYKFEPKFGNHSFSPVFQNVLVNNNVSAVDFRDVTTRTISGKLSDGCNQYIGTAVLEFSDILPNDADGNPRTSCFRKRVTTNLSSGTYSITLPARKYKVKVISFSPAFSQGNMSYIFPTDLVNFFNDQYPVDSLTRDITTNNATLDLKFVRAPQIQIMSGLDTMCGNVNRGFSVFQQEVLDSFRIKAFEGHPDLGCTIVDTTTKIQVFTNVHAKDLTSEEFRYNPTSFGPFVKLKGGNPYIINPYLKDLNIQYTDKYSRQAPSISKKVLVTGVKADVATFTTVSPEIPMLILHDPPGDNSFSFWQSNQTIETAMRMFMSKGDNTTAWAEVKIGTKFEAGLGVSTETSIWGSINGAVNVGSTNTSSNETILSTTTSQYLSTSSSPTVTGDAGDLYVGAALNLLYSAATEISFSNCTASSSRKLIVANDGFATQYIYTEEHIRKTLIPSLIMLSQNPTNTPAQVANWQNQVRVWQQVLENNRINKARAIFDKNISFDGSAGPITNSTTSSVSKSNTVEFGLTIDRDLAIELGVEIGGSGASGGVTLNFKTETGSSNATTITKETTTGYTLDDDDNGDYFSVNIKKDPVYNTPVFELVAATASCPAEDGAQPRDEMHIVAPVPQVSGVPESNEALFLLKLANTSQSGETRTYKLSFDQSSNPHGAEVKIGGTSAQTPVEYPISYLGEMLVTVSVKKPAGSGIYSFEGLRFQLTDVCGGDSSKSALLTANFINNCSGIKLSQPENNWMFTSANNNLMQILVKDYNVAGLTFITLEYSPAGTSNWVSAFSKTAAQLNPNGANGTILDWNVTGLTDGVYNLRIKLNCAQGVIYSERSTGIIDRTAPKLVGKPEPTDDVYVNGDLIAFNYNEAIELSALSNMQVVMRRLSNQQLIPVNVTGFNNRVVVTPLADLNALAGDSIIVVVSGVSDKYGNVKITTDTANFIIGNFIPATGNSALNISIVNQKVYRNTDSTMRIVFTLPSISTKDVRVNYSISGTAKMGEDYVPRYIGTQPLATSFNGAQGTIVIRQNSRQAVLLLDPVCNNTTDTGRTIIISLTEGGDYGIGANNTVSGIITFADSLVAPLVVTPAATSICAGQSATLTASGGTSYSWNTGATTAAITVSPTTTTQYMVSSTDANGCTATKTATVTVNNAPAISYPATLVYTVGTSSTVVMPNTTGVVSSYSISPALPAGLSFNLTTGAISGTPTAVSPATNYTITGTGTCGSGNSTFNLQVLSNCNTCGIPVTIAPSGISTNAATVRWRTVECATGYQVQYRLVGAPTASLVSVSDTVLTLTGLTSSSTYEYRVRTACGAQNGTFSAWATFSTFGTGCSISSVFSVQHITCNGLKNGSFTVTASGGTAPYQYKIGTGGTYQSSGTFTGLKATSYRVYILDANGCTGFTSIIEVSQPAPLSTTVTATDISCSNLNNGTITVNVVGGSAPFSYKIGTKGIYQASNVFANLKANMYRIYVKDASGCETPTDVVTIARPEPLAATFTTTDVTCTSTNNGTVTVNLTGGKLPYQYRLGTSGAWQFSNTFSGLRVTQYRVYYRDGNNCLGSTTIIPISKSPAVTASHTTTNVSCNGGSDGTITVTPLTGKAPFAYRLNSGNWMGVNTFSNVKAGTHTIIIIDSAGCQLVIPNIVIEEPDALLWDYTKVNATCPGVSDGSITVFANGGTPPYQYRIGSRPNQPSNIFTGLKPTLYRIYITDAAGCVINTPVIEITNESPACTPSIVREKKVQEEKPVQKFDAVLYPNPSTSMFSLQVSSSNDEPVHVRVVDLSGRIVHQVQAASSQTIRFGEKLNTGMYIVEVRQDREVKTLKAVKIK